MNKNCLIVGASGEIGGAIASHLAEQGYSLLLHYYKNRQAVEKCYHDLPAGAVLDIIPGDLSNVQGIQEFLAKLHFHVDIVVFASGASHYGLFQDTDESVMDQLLSVHVKALWLISKHLLPGMISRRSGQILVISSIWGEEGASCEVIYSSVKGAQNSFIKALAKELGPSGIKVNGVSPGFIDTKMNARFSDEEKQDLIEQIPVNRVGQAEEVAHLVSFLLDAKSNYIQGEIIKISGGW